MVTWDPLQYARFADARLRPGLELIERLRTLEGFAPSRGVDLGCGTGELTETLAGVFSGLDVFGLDSSADMLAKARNRFPNRRWEEADIGQWQAAEPLDLVYSNAALQWVDGHDALFPRLVGMLAPGGVLAVQMPTNYTAPSHRLLADLADLEPYRGLIRLRRDPVASPAVYYDMLAATGAVVDIWSVTYLQVLEGEDPVFEWCKGSALRPVFATLKGDLLDGFLATYREALRQAYPPRPDGRTLFPFERLFLLARRQA